MLLNHISGLHGLNTVESLFRVQPIPLDTKTGVPCAPSLTYTALNNPLAAK